MTAPVDHTTVRIPVFEEGRLRYRAPRWSDFDVYAAFRAGPRSAGVGGQFPAGSAFTSLCALIGHWELRGYGRWVIEDRETGAPLGVVGPLYPPDWPEPEISWSLFDGAEGRGIAFEAARFALRYAYGMLGWTTAISCVLPDNDRSRALARRLGAVRDGDHTISDGTFLEVWRHRGPEAFA